MGGITNPWNYFQLCDSEFQERKTLLEESVDCSFVKSTGCKEVTKENARAIYCQCTEETQRKRRVKPQGDSW